MKRVLSFSLAVVVCFCAMVASERRAWGYVDPGSGLLALQGLASAAAATAYMLRRKIAALFARKPKSVARKPARVVTVKAMPPVAARKNDSRNAA
jgi:hypothetical protein